MKGHVMNYATREQQIREHAKRLANRFSTRYGYSTMEETLCDMGRWCDANPPSPWVSVDERMPDKRKDKNGFTDGISVEVLAKTDKGERVTAWYSYQIETWFMCMGEIGGEPVLPYRVVAWMDIPQ